ncbi:Putative NAD(P)-binding domain superfamily [Septoria linicola]|uniref:NAD(P)-binding domain superfamily n=1 Tax=Septoria linicola TaxID=215465 RepID=A0A9Q9AJ62_9PEZI|nr:Putative NAD(P)-binding domain superfamily [Septoria linicola]
MAAPLIFINRSDRLHRSSNRHILHYVQATVSSLSVRKEAQVGPLRRALNTFSDRLEFVVIPDITKPGAFDAALEGADYVIHVASPLPKPNEDLLTPAVKGTTGLLGSALRVSSIKKVVVTAGHCKREAALRRFDNSLLTQPWRTVPKASKIASYLATLDFVETKKPQFSVVTLRPVYIFGRNLLQTSADELTGTNGGVHVDDVAEAHIRALTLPDAQVSSFPLAGKDGRWEEVLEFANKKFPRAGFTAKPKPGDGMSVDTGLAEAQLGFSSWKEMEVQVSDVVEQQLDFRGTKKA